MGKWVFWSKLTLCWQAALSSVGKLRQRVAKPGRSKKKIALSVAGAVTVLATVVLGSGFATQTLKPSTEGAWLLNRSAGAASHASAVSGDIDYRVTFEGATGNDLAIVQKDDGTYLLNRTTGELARMDESLMKLGAANKVPASPSMELLVGDDAAYIVDRGKGTVTPVDRTTLDVQGDSLNFPSGFSSAVVDPQSNILVAPVEAGIVIPIVGGEEKEPIQVGEQGDYLDLTTVNQLPVAVNLTKLQFTSISADGRSSDPTQMEGISDGSDLVISDSQDQNRLWVLDRSGGQLHWVNPANSETDSFPIEDKGKDLGRPVVNGGTVYVPQPSKARVLAYQEDGTLLREIDVPKKADLETFVKDERLWLNDPDSAWAANIDLEGQITEFDKYTKTAPTTELAPEDDGELSEAFQGTNPPNLPQQPNKSPTNKPETPDSPAATPAPTPFPSEGPDNTPNDDPDDGTEGDGKGAPPGAPRNLVASAGDEQVTLSWDKAQQNGRKIKQYLVEEIRAGTVSPISVDPNEDGSSRHSLVVPDLENGIEYQFEVRAEASHGGEGDRAKSYPVTPSADNVNAPYLLSVAPGQSSLELFWQEPDSGSQTIDGYEAEVFNGTQVWSVDDLDAEARSTSIDGLENGVAYSVQIRAKAKSGAKSDWVMWRKAVTPQGPPDAPTILSVMPKDGSLEVTFAQPSSNGSGITGYEYRVGSSAEDGEPVGISGSPFTIPDLTNGTSYAVQVRALNGAEEGDGRGEWSSSARAIPQSAPPAPNALAAEVDNGFVVLNWEHPPAGEGYLLDGFLITINGVEHSRVGKNTTSRMIRLNAGGNVYIGVASVGQSGAVSEPDTIEVTVPGRPIIQISGSGATHDSVWGSMNVDWNGSSEDSYCQANLKGTPRETVSCDGRISYSGLQPGREYVIQLRAVNAVGTTVGTVSVSTDSITAEVQAIRDTAILIGSSATDLAAGTQVTVMCRLEQRGTKYLALTNGRGYVPTVDVTFVAGRLEDLPTCP